MIAQIITMVLVAVLGIAVLLLLPLRKKCADLALEVRGFYTLRDNRDFLFHDLKTTREQLNVARNQRDIYQGHASNLARCMTPEYRNKRSFRKMCLRRFEEYRQADATHTESVIASLPGFTK